MLGSKVSEVVQNVSPVLGGIYRHEVRDRHSVPGDLDDFSFEDPVDQGGKMGLCFVSPNTFQPEPPHIDDR